MRYFITLITIAVTLNARGQEAFNHFKYLQVASQYEFQSSPNEYDFNDLALFLLKKNGFIVFKNTDVLPVDFNRGACNSLSVKITSSGSLSQKINVDFADCAGTVIYNSLGVSSIKDYRKAYHEALRKALAFLEGFKHDYSPNGNTAYLDLSENNVLASTLQPKFLSYSHKTSNLLYSLVETGEVTYDIYKYTELVGSMRKAGSGNYIVTIDDYNGLGYVQDNNLVVEYDRNGSLEKLVLIPFVKN
jgi:hypothetical protein